MTPPAVQATSRSFEGAGGVRIAGCVYGPESSEAVVFLHGGGQSKSAWRGAARRIAGLGLRTCSIDLRGHGESDWARDGNYSLDHHIADLHSVVAGVADQCVLVGASLGGHISLMFASAYPGQVRALALADVTPWIDEDAADDLRALIRSAGEGFATVEEAATMVDRMRGTAPRNNAEGLRKHLEKRDDDRLYWRWDPRFVEDRFVRHGGESGRFAAAAKRLSVPTLLMRAEFSDVVSREQVARFREVLPTLEYCEIDGARHMVTGEDNDAYAEAIIAFLKRLDIGAN